MCAVNSDFKTFCVPAADTHSRTLFTMSVNDCANCAPSPTAGLNRSKIRCVTDPSKPIHVRNRPINLSTSPATAPKFCGEFHFVTNASRRCVKPPVCCAATSMTLTNNSNP